jgi:acyl carrier protein
MSINDSVEETVKKIAEKILRKTDIVFAPNTTFKDLGADSLDIVQILAAVEDTYDIELSDEELQDVKDTAGFVSYVENKLAEKTAKETGK